MQCLIKCNKIEHNPQKQAHEWSDAENQHNGNVQITGGCENSLPDHFY